jgi:hypothetical protein
MTTGETGYPVDWWFSLDGEWWIPVNRKPCRIDIEDLVLMWEAQGVPRTSRAYLESAFHRSIRYHS